MVMSLHFVSFNRRCEANPLATSIADNQLGQGYDVSIADAKPILWRRYWLISG